MLYNILEKNSLITVITTVRNGENFIEETLLSVSQQTYENYEHIIIDDGSTDNTVEIIEEFQENNSNNKINLIKSQGIGRGKALNLAVSKANGSWLAIIDADDLWHSEKLKIQFECVLNNNIDVLATEGTLFTNTSELIFENTKKVADIQYITVKDLLKSNRLSHSSVLIRKSICSYDEERESQFDYELWLRIASQGKILAKINDNLNFHRIHSNQTFEGKMGKKYRWRSFKLKLIYSFKKRYFGAILYNIAKLFFDFLFPRKARLLIKNKLKIN